MKKIFAFITLVTLAVACENMYGPVETPTAPDQAGTVQITVDKVEDNGIEFTIAPVGETSYYSYFVAAGAAQEVDPTAVYQCKAGGILKGTYKASETPQMTITVENLAPNSVYTIYAVAGSLQGIPGEVATEEVTTTDGVAIAIAGASKVDDYTLTLTFSENVVRGEGDVTAVYYASVPSVKAMGQVTATVTTEGKTATVAFEGIPAGAYYAVSYPAGAFTDAVGNPIAAMTSGYNAEAKKFAGISARVANANFNLASAFPAEYASFGDWQTAVFSVSVADEGTIIASVGEGAATANYMTPGKTTIIDMTYGVNYIFGEGGIMMMCPEQPEFGTEIVFSFEEDAFKDIWGNSSNAVAYETMCAYDYTLADAIGTFEYMAYDNVTKAYDQKSFTIEESDNPEEGNVMITSFAGIPCMAPIYATFTPESGSLEIYGQQIFYAYADEEGNEIWYVFYTYNNEYLHLSMPEAGVFTNPDDYFGVAIAVNGSLTQWAALYLDFQAEKVEATPSVAAQSAEVVKFTKTLPLNVR